MFLFQFTTVKIFTLVQALGYLYFWAFLRQVCQTKLWKLYLTTLSIFHQYQGCDFPSSMNEYNLLQYTKPDLLAFE